MIEQTKYCYECRNEHPYYMFEGRYSNICKLWKWAEGSIKNAFKRSQRINDLRKTIGEEPLSFSITPRDLLYLWEKQKGKCFYTGFDFFPPWLDKYKDKDGLYTPSIDRLDNEIGYESNNIVLSSHYINALKNDKSIEEFLAELEDSAYIYIQVISKLKSSLLKEKFDPNIFMLNREYLFEIMLKQNYLKFYNGY
jgi:hypothetical protein